MSLYDEDGIDGPFDLAMDTEIRRDSRRRDRNHVQNFSKVVRHIMTGGHVRGVADPLDFVFRATIDLVQAARRSR